MNLTVTVTQDDIDNGKPNEASACPLALAMKRAWPGARTPRLQASVQHDRAAIWPDLSIDVAWTADLPGNAQAFVKDFDAYDDGRLRVRPFTFGLDFEADNPKGTPS